MTDLSKLGDTLGYPAFVPASKELAYLHNQRLGKVLIKEDSQIGKQLLYYIFCSDSYRHYVLASATGSTVKHTAPVRIQSFKIALPSLEIRNKFESIADSFNSQVACLNQKNDNLRKTRDLLLPKLISGQIDVENIDIDTGEIAA
jgi:type I restriction enzyme S subunit